MQLIQRTGAWVLLALLPLSAACDNLLDVETAGRIPAEQLEDPANAALLVNSAVADFECAFGAYVVLGGLIGEELADATQTASRYPYDQRTFTSSDSRYATFGCTDLGVYTPLQTARATADRAAELLAGATDAQVPRRQELLATARLYAGYAVLLMGEGFCSGVISTLDAAGNITYGAELSRPEMFQAAVQRFTAAMEAATAANNTDLLNAALVGRARAYLNLGNYAAARADALRVPPAFVRSVTASGVSSRRENRVVAQNSATSTLTSVGEQFRNLNDPRVPVIDTGRRSATGVPLFRQTKFTSVADPIPLATGDEARLIVAEAEARAGNLSAAVAIINQFRSAARQPAFSSTNAQAVLNEVIEQRRRELFLEGQHFGDVLRYDLELRPAAGTAFPGGGTYGNARCLPLPDVERLNNPRLR